MRRMQQGKLQESSTTRRHCRCQACEMRGKLRCRHLASYTLEAILILLLLFTLPHVVYGIVVDADTQQAASEQQTVEKGNSGATTTSAQAKVAFDHSAPHFKANRTGIVELFEWKFNDVAKECESFLGPKGFGGVQLSPVTEHLRAVNGTPTWRSLYQPISYKFATRLGSIEDFLEMSRACNAAGVRVYVDVVLNHMVGGGGGGVGGTVENENQNEEFTINAALLEGVAGSKANASALDYAEVPFTAADFHKPCPLENYLDSYEVRNCQLNGQPDLDQSKANVQERIVALLNALIDMGVAGFRIDAAKHIWPIDLKTIYADVNYLNSEEFDFPEDSRPFFYQEVVDLGMDAVSKTEYAGYGIVTEYLYAAELSTIFNGKVPLSTLINWGPAMGFVTHQDALVFVDTHESQCGYLKRELGQNQLLSYHQRRQHVMATVFMLAHPYGRIKRIMSSYYAVENEPESAPPMTTITTDNDEEVVDDAAELTESEAISSPEFDATNQQCLAESGWVCEHRWPPIVNMLTLANDLSPTEDGVINFQTFGPNHIAFCRGQKAFIAFNNDATADYETKVHTCLKPGIYCDVISGGIKPDGNDCLGKRIVVSEQGLADLMLPAVDVNVDAGNNNNPIEDQAASVVVDYGVIAIHIGSKLSNVGNALQFDSLQPKEATVVAVDSTTVVPTEGDDDAQVDGSDESMKNESLKIDKR